MSDYVNGVIVGLLIVFFIAILLVIAKRKSGALYEKYDERQILVRGKGYKISFMTTIVFLLLYGGVFYGISKDVIAPQFIIFLIAFIGILVYTVYCIFNDAYIQIGQNPRKWICLVAFVIIGNAYCALRTSDRGLTDNGLATSFMLNGMIAIVFTLILIAMLIKFIVDKKEGNNEES